VKLFVEGGGDSDSLKSRCREGFTTFLRKAGIENLPRIVASGGRKAAFDDFCTEVKQSGSAFLLVDSEEQVQGEFAKPWDHLKSRSGDRWEKPSEAMDSQCHLMVVCMESWFLGDKDSLELYYGQHFRRSALPQNPEIEAISKQPLFDGLKNATKDTKKGSYSKGDHSFRILKELDPKLVCAASPWADRLIIALKSAT
jgi:hypothetical protein